MFSTQLKTRTHLEFSLDKDNKVREQYSIVFTLSLLRLTLQREEVLDQSIKQTRVFTTTKFL